MRHTLATLEALAHAHGIHLVWAHCTPRGYYDHTRRVIVLRHGLNDREARTTLAHELGHALHGDTHTNDPHHHARQERRADEYAATLLISPAEYATAEAAYGTNPHTLARELDVSPHLIHVYRTLPRLAG